MKPIYPAVNAQAIDGNGLSDVKGEGQLAPFAG